ncbi:MAG: tRNA lysidine(34) synthetase TilS [Oscillospiraceae bacterium]|jgi:tRNA(Ile)-lysidine synthase|nr:tRNA lysidine(34) synthetase TilS [Oscillospiraceae bacterium]
MAEGLAEKAAETIREWGLLRGGETVTVGCSGGADSVALLDVLLTLRAGFGLTVRCAHLNHCLRREASDGDEAFVRELCAARKVPLAVRRVDVAALARERSVGLEEAGRLARYDFFADLTEGSAGEEIAREHLIALAHTLTDRLETQLLNLTRGAALRGLCSIPRRRGNIIRPLLDCTRAETEAHCAARGLFYRTDESNADPRFRRNAVRLEILPQLRRWNSALEEGAARTFRALERDEAYLTAQAEALLRQAARDGGWDTDALLAAPEVLRTRALRRLLEDAGVPVTFALLETSAAFLAAAGTRTLSGGAKLTVRQGVLRVVRRLPAQRGTEAFPVGWEAEAVPGAAPLPDGRIVRCDIVQNLSKKILQQFTKEDLANCLDYDTLQGTLCCTGRRPGDRFRPVGGAGQKEIKKLCQERGIPPQARGRLLVLRDDAGPAWLSGPDGGPAIGPADRCRITDQTRRMLKIAVGREGEDWNA